MQFNNEVCMGVVWNTVDLSFIYSFFTLFILKSKPTSHLRSKCKICSFQKILSSSVRKANDINYPTQKKTEGNPSAFNFTLELFSHFFNSTQKCHCFIKIKRFTLKDNGI